MGLETTEAVPMPEDGPGGDSPVPGRPRWSTGWRRAAVTAFVVGWLGLQVGVPTVRLIERGGAARPRTFGWQMFSHQLQAPPESFVITTANGSRQIEVRELLVGPMRREIVYGPAVVEALCERPEIFVVEVRDVEHGTRSVSCR